MDATTAPLFSLNVSQFEQLLKPIIAKAVAEAVISLQPAPQLEPADEIFLDEVTTLTRRSRSTIYRMTATREIPYSKRGRQLIFSRKTILEWMEGRTVNVPPLAEEAADHLQKVASKR
mgnify:CR=1 FL=1